MEKDFEPLKARLRIICDRLDEDEQQFFRPLIDNFQRPDARVSADHAGPR